GSCFRIHPYSGVRRKADMDRKSKKSWLRDSLNPGLQSNSQVKEMGDEVAPRRGSRAGCLGQPQVAS
ncbi:MAG: hypothetical protein NUW07_04810, partial [Candidatus Saccharicenans sp.]|nr:hypothetical protein [Candidatus Saccharicenans sp.]